MLQSGGGVIFLFGEEFTIFKLVRNNLKVSHRRHICNSYKHTSCVIIWMYNIYIKIQFRISSFNGPVPAIKLKDKW
jgi:hypothetical protein